VLFSGEEALAVHEGDGKDVRPPVTGVIMPNLQKPITSADPGEKIRGIPA